MALTKISGSILKDPLNLGEVSIGGTLTYQDVTNVDSVGIITAREGIFIPDSKKLHIGNTAGHGDLQLYHDGNSSFIHDTGTGGIYIPASEFTVTNTGITQSGIKFFEGGSVELYEAGSKKIETTSTGAVITGICTATSFSGDGSNLTGIDTDLVSDTSPQLGGDLASNGNDIVMADNDSVKLGASTDFIMFHDSSGHTYLQDQGNGALRIRSDSEVAIQKWDGSTNENMGKFVPDGAVELYHAGSKKFFTYSDGVHIDTGTLRGDDNAKIALGSGTNGDLQIYHNGTDTYLLNNTGKLRIRNSHADEIKLDTNSTTRWNIGGTGHIYPDLNNTYDIGNTTYRVRNIYTNDLNLSNEGSTNSVDNTWGDYTIQEGENDLFLINNRNGKKYKFNLTEVN